MYKNLGTQWASSVPAFLALVFAPLPFIFLRVGAKLRARSKFANEAKVQLAKLMEVRQQAATKLEQKEEASTRETSNGTNREDDIAEADSEKD